MNLLKSRHLLLLLALVLAGVLVTIVALRYRPRLDTAEMIKALPQGVELALQDINYTHTEGGVARWRLVAKQVEHRPAEQTIAVNDLQLTFFDAKGLEQGTLTARTGRVDRDFSWVEVRDEVTIVSRSGYTLQTDHLTYRQDERSVRTEAPVRLTAKGLQLDGTGLHLDLETRRLRVPAAVHAVLQPKH
jgi:LPS export ABC transporter protein LptC